MKTLKVVSTGKNGYGLRTISAKASPPIGGHEDVNIAAWRTVDGLYVTAVLSADESEDILSECVGGTQSHNEAAKSIGYDLQ